MFSILILIAGMYSLVDIFVNKDYNNVIKLIFEISTIITTIFTLISFNAIKTWINEKIRLLCNNYYLKLLEKENN